MIRWLLIMVLLPIPAIASIGTVTQQRGDGVVERSNERFSSAEGFGIESMDTVITDQGRLQLDFVDDTRVDVTENSRVVIDEFIYDPASQQGALSMRATLGAVRYASGAIAANNRQRVNIATPSATISVRGTDFMMIVDEIGGSMITLLPSCNTAGLCVVGEISIETPVGIVIMNQAFQTTVVSHSGSAPRDPLVLDLPENMLTSMLIVRKVSPYEEVAERAAPSVDILDFDFLAYSDLDVDLLADRKGLWETDLDQTGYLDDVMYDALDQLMAKLAAQFADELASQNEEFFRTRELGTDPETGIFYDELPPNFVVSRTDTSSSNTFKLELNQQYGYSIDMRQAAFSNYGYRVGVGNNSIYIDQNN
jgi:hypothetical protein